MKAARLLILLVAIAAGGAAFFMLAGNDEPAVTTAVPTAPIQPRMAMAEVMFSAKDIPQGAILSEGMVKWVKWPSANVPEFFITKDDQDFIDNLGLRRARLRIDANQPIYGVNTVAHGDRGMLASILTPGMRAVTARMGLEETSGGFILPGDRVDIFATGIGDDGQMETSAILRNIRVLAIDQVTNVTDEQTALNGSTVTFELSPAQVPSFIGARDNKQLTLVLRSVYDLSPETGMPIVDTSPEEVVVIRFGQG
ncbi:CtpC protein [Parvularcula bermudensis HTCC2503]|uniref:CtpC protein n=1 Tax=Parvularcula bermudensis (strain ATCC BAA-594 / HTCC2503 / KCTC 12087) TaxID=314260 RepID=E0TGA4_PARBH|nr:Flp pilus assembly protein CpaB [Parvularcula bermudensis]ADM09147.1 CtpC protein [Parvularcula bermudensis HTCC2503]